MGTSSTVLKYARIVNAKATSLGSVTRGQNIRWMPIVGASKSARALSFIAFLLGMAPSPVLALPAGKSVILALPEAMPAWVDEIYTLVQREDLEGAIDILFEHVDEMLLAEKMSECDAFLRTIDIRRLEPNLMVGLLSVTLSAADQLPNRKVVAASIRGLLEQQEPERVERMLVGLE